MIAEFTRRPKWFQICRQWCFTKFIVSLNSTTHQTERFLKGSLGIFYTGVKAVAYILYCVQLS